MNEGNDGWPRLDYAADQPTIESLHMLLQLVGKLPLRLHPWLNHGWHAALRLTPRGARTRAIPVGRRAFTLEVDFATGAIRIECDGGDGESLSAAGKTIAAVHRELTNALSRLGLPAPLHGGPNEVPDPVVFARDERPRAWDGEAAARLHGGFRAAGRVLTRFRASYRGKASPSQLFWGSFDLAATRFSGRPAPKHPGGIPGLPDAVTREAYSHEEISAGFWPGNAMYPRAAFYAYAYPSPPGLGGVEVSPAKWNAEMGEFLLDYEVVRKSADPDAVVTEFLERTYLAAAERLDWPAGQVIAGSPTFGKPPA